MYVILTCPVFTVILTELFHIQNFIVLHDDNKLDGILYFAKKTVVGMTETLFVVNRDAKSSTTTCENRRIKQMHGSIRNWLSIMDCNKATVNDAVKQYHCLEGNEF